MPLPDVFRAEPMLTDRHRDELKKRAISAEFAIKNGVFTAADNELRRLSFDADLPLDQRNQGLQGILFTYRTLDGSGDPVYRLKPDLRFCLNGKQAKYLSRNGDPLRPYFPQTTVPNDAKNTKVNVIIAEGEFKTLSLAQNIVPICSRKTCVIAASRVSTEAGAATRSASSARTEPGRTKKSGTPTSSTSSRNGNGPSASSISRRDPAVVPGRAPEILWRAADQSLRLVKASGLSSATFYRQIGPLESCGKITRDGNLYRFNPGLRTPHSEDEA